MKTVKPKWLTRSKRLYIYFFSNYIFSSGENK